MIVLEFIQTLIEARTPHPEDSIFSGKQEALSTVKNVSSIVSKPQSVSIKWDGSPAIIFGRRAADGLFTMNYKEYIAMPGGQVTSAEELQKFYATHAKNTEVGNKLAAIFNAIATIVPKDFKGFVQGDLMWDTPIKPFNGKFVFRPNPYGVIYKVGVNTPLGQQIVGRPIGVAVHTYGTDIVAGKNPLTDKRSMNGLGGLLPTNQHITVLTGNMGHQFKLKTPVALVNSANAAIAKHGDVVQAFLDQISATAAGVLQTYYNRKYTNQPVDATWLETKLGAKQFAIVSAPENKAALLGLDTIYAAIYKLKLAFLDQLEPQVKDVEQYVNTAPKGSPDNLVPKGEGFNIDTPNGFVKLVNRGVFSAANFAGRA